MPENNLIISPVFKAEVDQIDGHGITEHNAKTSYHVTCLLGDGFGLLFFVSGGCVVKTKMYAP